MESETQRKIEDTVKDILREADMEDMTEFKVRVAASERLGIELSGIEHKRFIRGVLEFFLLSNAEDGKETEMNVREENREKGVMQEKHKAVMVKKEVNGDYGDRLICKLSNKRSVLIQDFRGKPCLSIRDYYQKKECQIPYSKGISLTTEQWSAVKKSIPAIEEAIIKMQSKLRSELDVKQNEDVSNSVTDCTHEFVPIETIRFGGKNYHCWAQQMELFLKQLKLAYVLTDPCPGSTFGPEARTEEIAQTKAAERKWVSDDFLCRQNILNSLSDHLYYQYSKKSKSAKELWDELQLVYLYEEFGTNRSLVRKYIEFQMFDENPILEQVYELNKITDAIVAAGMSIDENFHVSSIISKFPPSWKDFCIKLMREEYLPFWMLMDKVRVEEESRNRDRQGEMYKFVNLHQAKNLGPRMRDIKKSGIDNKVMICYNCGKKGHISKHCRTRKFVWEANVKPDGDNLTTPVVAEVSMTESNME